MNLKTRKCKLCSINFKLSGLRDSKRRKFCSQKCYQTHIKEQRMLCSKCGTLKKFMPCGVHRCYNCLSKWRRQRHLKDPRYYMFHRAKHRAKELGLPFTITLENITIPLYCPVFHILLEVGTRKARNNAPSLDRIIPSLGYVPENIMVISNRANQIKNDATDIELEQVLSYVRKQKTTTTATD